MQQQQQKQQQQAPSLPVISGIVHSRSRSAPVQPVIPKRQNALRAGEGPLNRSLPAAQQQQQQQQQNAQQSTMNPNVDIELHRIRLPPNWEVATTPEGNTYFVDHARQTTTNDDPRIQIKQELLCRHYELCRNNVSTVMWF